MAWKPIYEQPKDSAWKTLVSRVTMLVFGVLLLFACYKCVSKGLEITAELTETLPERRSSSVHRSRAAQGVATATGMFWIGAAATGLPGLALAIAGVMPTSFLERFVGD